MTKLPHSKKAPYGTELLINLHSCDTSVFTEQSLLKYLVDICEQIDMKRHGEPMFWFDDSDIEHLRGVSAVQFIETSTIVIHSLDILEKVFVNIFSCKPFDHELAAEFTARYFGAQGYTKRTMVRD